jgi:hypothetical protein
VPGMLPRPHRKIAAIAPAVLAIMGCGGAYDASVSGNVTLDGNPVTTGAVAFIPATPGPMAYAQVDPSGYYEVFTGKEAGLPPGSYDVTVVSREPPATERSDLGGPPRPGKALTPLWYSMEQQTPLKFQVEPGHNDIDLQLTSTPPQGWKPPQGQR